MTILNITNGDGAAEIIKASLVPGDVLPWRDPMHHGPFPAGLSLDALRPHRAKYLAGHGLAAQEVERDILLRDEHLRAAPQYEKVILWFEHDLLDQLQLLQILDWFSTANLGGTALGMICINSFPGFAPFRGIGQLDPIQMASLSGQSRAVTSQMMELARDGWQAFRSDDPRGLLRFCDRDLHPLPFLKDALRRHLEEFPSALSGLTRTEEQILTLVKNGTCRPPGIFVANMDLETALFIGDWPTYRTISTLCNAGLLEGTDGPFREFTTSPQERETFNKQTLRLTEMGQNVLAGQTAPAPIIPRDQWLGGVHIKTGEQHWTWNPTTLDLEWRNQ